MSPSNLATNVIAYVSQSAFWGLLISAVEVYKRECFGLLIGYRDRQGPDQRYIIEHAVPYQSAGRRHRTVVNNPRAHRPIERFLRSIPRCRDQGLPLAHDVGLQPGGGPPATPTSGMTSGNVYLILSVNDRLRGVPWSYNDDGCSRDDGRSPLPSHGLR